MPTQSLGVISRINTFLKKETTLSVMNTCSAHLCNIGSKISQDALHSYTVVNGELGQPPRLQKWAKAEVRPPGFQGEAPPLASGSREASMTPREANCTWLQGEIPLFWRTLREVELKNAQIWLLNSSMTSLVKVPIVWSSSSYYMQL